MNLHEYQAKTLFTSYGIPVPEGVVITELEDLPNKVQGIAGDSWVVKAQIHAGARGKVGGVKVVNTLERLQTVCSELLGSNLATPQTHGKVLPVKQLLIEQTLDIQRELYLGMLIDRSKETIALMASAAGGMDIEKVAAKTPEKIITIYTDPLLGLQAYQCRQVAFSLGLVGKQIATLSKIMLALDKLFREKDISLVEINPLVVTKDEQLLALDAKINIDDNALYRHQNIRAMRDISQENAREAQAAEHDLNYIALEGNIGCMVNGAGLAMATMDLIKLHGGEPANFLDVGGGTTAERVAEAFKLILTDTKVAAILVNIFGGIVRCDLIAEGIIQAVKEVGVTIPVIVRLEGTNAKQGLELLAHSGLNVETASDLTTAAQRAVASVVG